LQSGVATCYGNISTVKYGLKQYKDALFNSFKSYAIYRQLKANSDIKEMKNYIEYFRKDMGIDTFKKYAELGYKALELEFQKEIILSDFLKEPRIVGKKYGRNEKVKVRYTNGLIAEKKYKQVEVDIKDEKCEIIE